MPANDWAALIVLFMVVVLIITWIIFNFQEEREYREWRKQEHERNKYK